MTTVLNLYARAALMLAAILSFLFLFVAIAFAQDAPTVAVPPDGGWDQALVMLRDGFVASVLAIISGLFAWLAPKLPGWLKSVIEAVESRDSNHWEDYVRKLAETAFASAGGAAAHKLDTLEGKAGALGAMLKFVRVYGNDLYQYLDQDDNKVLDVLEAQLRRIAPNLAVTPEGTPPAPIMQQGFMAEPPAPVRRPRASTAEMAAKLAPLVPPAAKRASSRMTTQ